MYKKMSIFIAVGCLFSFSINALASFCPGSKDFRPTDGTNTHWDLRKNTGWKLVHGNKIPLDSPLDPNASLLVHIDRGWLTSQVTCAIKLDEISSVSYQYTFEGYIGFGKNKTDTDCSTRADAPEECQWPS